MYCCRGHGFQIVKSGMGIEIREFWSKLGYFFTGKIDQWYEDRVSGKQRAWDWVGIFVTSLERGCKR